MKQDFRHWSGLAARDSPDLARVLDCGAEGVVVAHVETVGQARHVVEKCRFQPVGKRSLPSPLVRLGFRVPPAAQMMAEIEKDTLVVLMIESATGVAAAEAIAAVDGVDVLMIGANDLAADMGHIGAVDLQTFRPPSPPLLVQPTRMARFSARSASPNIS